MTQMPRRALIISASIGEGHNSAGRALREAMARAWPDCQVRWMDALAVMGPGFGRLARGFYVTQVQRTPRMYEFFFSAMWRHRWYLNATRQLLGWWFGRRMAPHIRAARPELIVSTYPLASAGLSWLRAHGQLPMPAGAWVPAFCPHPSWLYANLDITYVMHPAALAVATQAEPGARIAVGALPVRDAFRAEPVPDASGGDANAAGTAGGACGALPARSASGPGGQQAARERLGLPGGRFVVALCTGSLGFGRAGRAVTALLAAGPDVLVVVVCGRNRRLRAELAARGEPPDRLRVLGWTDDMPGLMTAANVVVGNAGGATGLEALASGRPVAFADPIAGHGRANAELMASAGLAVVARSPAELTATIGRLAGDPAARARQAGTALAAAAGRRCEDDLARLAAMAAR